MKTATPTCAGYRFYGAIDPTVGNCRVDGGTRSTLAGASASGACGRHQPVANDNAPLRATA